jgi:XTP/dITP diphosphohydrolase
MTQSLLIATNNPGKVKEIHSLLAGLGIELLTPGSLNLKLEVEENGTTYAENASKKAAAFALASRLVSLADDSGLEVDVLEGRPGLRSARFSPLPGATDADRRAFLLQSLAGRPRPWTARFRATVAIAVPGASQIWLTESVCEGEIIPDERGSHGFGYDPIFFLPQVGHTMAELEMGTKNTLSHRALAVQKAIPMLKELLEV